MANYIIVKPEILRWAVQYSDLSEDEIYFKFPWVCKTPAKATFRQLEKFSQFVRVPFSSLLLGEIPPEEPLSIPDCRTMSDQRLSQPSLNLRAILHIMSLRQEWMRDYLISEGADPLAFIGSLKNATNPVQAAKKIREDLGLEDGWQNHFNIWENAYNHLWDVIEESGVMLFQESGLDTTARKRFRPEEFRGFVMSDDYAPLIFINSADAKSARMFTLAHEMAHLWMGNGGLFDFAKEDMANRIAVEFLVSKLQFRKAWEETSDFGQLSRRFKVSTIVIARRAYECSFIKSDEFWAFFRSQQKKFEMLREKQSQKEGGPSFYTVRMRNLSMNFVFSVISSAQTGKILYRDAYNLIGIKGKTFDEFASRCMSGVQKS